MFHGSLVALVTPMHSDGSLDLDALSRLIEWHIESKTDGLVVVGTTGESPTLHAKEKRDLIHHTVKCAKGRIPVIAGTGSNATDTSIELTQMAMEAGADACLIVTPYYNKPTQVGLYQHYRAIARAVPIPQILYNVPGRTACDLQPNTVAKLASIANIIGIKEASGQLARVKQVLASCPDNFYIYSGDDALALSAIKCGAKGVISVTANVAPAQMSAMCAAARQGDFEKADQINQLLMELHQRLFIESNPIPVKWALQQMGLIESGIRLPLTPLGSEYHATLRQAMAAQG